MPSDAREYVTGWLNNHEAKNSIYVISGMLIIS